MKCSAVCSVNGSCLQAARPPSCPSQALPTKPADRSRSPHPYQVRTASCQAQGCINSFGDEQLAVDLVADKLLFEALRYSHVCKYACSEEVPEPVDVEGSGFCVAFDPLDGSSIVDTNFAVGTIFGVWPGD